MSLVIYASELAAVIGYNKYKPIDEALLEVLKRNKPDIYQKALNRNKKKEININKVINDLKLENVVENAIKSENKVELEKIVNKFDKNDKTEKEVISFIYKSRGINEEDKIVDKHEKVSKKKVNKRNSQLYKYVVNNCITLMGRCDGIQKDDDDKNVIVEVKNRQKWFFFPIYEKIQINVYMMMTGIHKCTFIQRLHGVDKTDTYTFDSELWEDIESRLINTYNRMNVIYENEEEQDKLFEYL